MSRGLHFLMFQTVESRTCRGSDDHVIDSCRIKSNSFCLFCFRYIVVGRKRFVCTNVRVGPKVEIFECRQGAVSLRNTQYEGSAKGQFKGTGGN